MLSFNKLYTSGTNTYKNDKCGYLETDASYQKYVFSLKLYNATLDS